MLGQYLQNVRARAPLVHCITNYVTANDCANILLAAGASPIMSDDIREVSEITSLCGGLAVNIGTLNRQTIPAMFQAGKTANALNKPVILDPVGAVTTETLNDAVSLAERYARMTGAVIAVTGAVDIVTDGSQTYLIRNGHLMMSRITGSGCMLTVLTGAYLAANPAHILEAASAGISAMGLAGQRAHEKLKKTDGGSATYRGCLIDEIFRMTAEELDAEARYELR